MNNLTPVAMDNTLDLITFFITHFNYIEKKFTMCHCTFWDIIKLYRQNGKMYAMKYSRIWPSFMY